jgi:hypothetical protein
MYKIISRIPESYPLSVSIFLFIFGTTGNAVIIIIIICNNDMRNVPNMYILNLAISDIIYLTVLFLDSLKNIIYITWLEDEIGCAFFEFCYRMSVGLTAYCVAVLSIQRYRVTANPLHVLFSSQPTYRGTGAIIWGKWIGVALFSIPAVRSYYCCATVMYLIFTDYYYYHHHHLAIFYFLEPCVLPLCVIAFSYIMTARHLVNSSYSVSEET